MTCFSWLSEFATSCVNHPRERWSIFSATPRGKVIRYKVAQTAKVSAGVGIGACAANTVHPVVSASSCLPVVTHSATATLGCLSGVVAIVSTVNPGTYLAAAGAVASAYVTYSGVRGCWKTASFRSDAYAYKQPEVITLETAQDDDPVGADFLARAGVKNTSVGLSLHGKYLSKTTLKLTVTNRETGDQEVRSYEFCAIEDKSVAPGKDNNVDLPIVPLPKQVARTEAFSGDGYLVDHSEHLPGCTFAIWVPKPGVPIVTLANGEILMPRFPQDYRIYTLGDYINCKGRRDCDFGCTHTYARLERQNPKTAYITVGTNGYGKAWRYTDVSISGKFPKVSEFLCLAKTRKVPDWFINAVVPENSLMAEEFHPYDAGVFQWDLKWPMLEGIQKFKGGFEKALESRGVSYSIDSEKGVYKVDPMVRVVVDNAVSVNYGCCRTTCEGSRGTSSAKSWTNRGTLSSMHHGGTPGVKGLRNRATHGKQLEQLRTLFENYGKGCKHQPDYTAFKMQGSVWKDLVGHMTKLIDDEKLYGKELYSLPPGFHEDMYFSPGDFVKPLNTDEARCAEVEAPPIGRVAIQRAMKNIKRNIHKHSSGSSAGVSKALLYAAAKEEAAAFDEDAHDELEREAEEQQYLLMFRHDIYGDGFDISDDEAAWWAEEESCRCEAPDTVFGSYFPVNSKHPAFSERRYRWAVWNALKHGTERPKKSDFPRWPDKRSADVVAAELAKKHITESPSPTYVGEAHKLAVHAPEEPILVDIASLPADTGASVYGPLERIEEETIQVSGEVQSPQNAVPPESSSPPPGFEGTLPSPSTTPRKFGPATRSGSARKRVQKKYPKAEGAGAECQSPAPPRSVEPAATFPVYLGDYDERVDEDVHDVALPSKEMKYDEFELADGTPALNEESRRALIQLQSGGIVMCIDGDALCVPIPPERVPGLRKSLLRANLLGFYKKFEEWVNHVGAATRAEVHEHAEEMLAYTGVNFDDKQKIALFRALEYGMLRDEHGRSIPRASDESADAFWTVFADFLDPNRKGATYACLKAPMRNLIGHLNHAAGVLDGDVKRHEVWQKLLGKQIARYKGREASMTNAFRHEQKFSNGQTKVSPEHANYIGKTPYKSGDFKSVPWKTHDKCDGWFETWKPYVWDNKGNRPSGSMAAKGPEYIVRSLNSQLSRKYRRKQAYSARHLAHFSRGLPAPDVEELLDMSIEDYFVYLFHDINASKGTAHSRLSGHMTKGDFMRDPETILACILTIFLTVALDHTIAAGASPLALFEYGILCPEEIFGKNEIHLNKKVDADRLRIIWNAAARFEIVMRFFHHLQNKIEIALFQEGCTHTPAYPTFGQCVGMGHDENGIQRTCEANQRMTSFQAEEAEGFDILSHFDDNTGYFPEVYDQLQYARKTTGGVRRDYASACSDWKHRLERDSSIANSLINGIGGKYIEGMGPHNGVSSDPQGWDISVTRALAMADAWRRADAAFSGGFGVGWCYGLMNLGLVSSAHIVVIADDMFELLWFGMLSSGIPSTSATNSFERIFLHSEGYWSTVKKISLSLGMGDDGVGRNRIQQPQLDAWQRLGCQMKPPEFSDLGGPVSFTSHSYNIEAKKASYDNIPKLLLRLAYAGTGSDPITKEQATGIRFAARNTPLLLRLVEDFIRYYDTTGSWLEVDIHGDIPVMDLSTVF